LNDLDRATALLIADAPYFRERYTLARRKLSTARDGGDRLHFVDGATCDACGCDCQEAINCVCVHQAAWRIHSGATP